MKYANIWNCGDGVGLIVRRCSEFIIGLKSKINHIYGWTLLVVEYMEVSASPELSKKKHKKN